jgi:hypothetical protein
MNSNAQDGTSCLGDTEKGLESTVCASVPADLRTTGPISEDQRNPISEETQLRKSQGLAFRLSAKFWHHVTQKSNSSFPIDTSPPPDGGIKAWSVVACCHVVGFNTWGFLNCFGVLQSFYVSALNLPPSDISWIGSIQAFFLFFVGALSGRLSDAGYFHQTLFVGTALQILGVFGASFAKTYWQLLLSHGVCVGIGGGLVFVPALSLVGTYFSKRQSLALSICACGNSIGGLVYAAMFQSLLPQLGLGWALRICGFVFVATMIPANFVLKPRAIKRSTGPIVEWAAFKEPAYAFFAAGMFFCMVGMWVPVFYVSGHSNSKDEDENNMLNRRSLDLLDKI